MGEYIDYLRGYATPRDDSAYTGLNADFGRRLMTMLQAAPEHVRRPDLIESLARDDAAQRRAINSAAQRLYGRPASIMEYIRGIPGYAAPVGGSQHQSGRAADINWNRLPPEGRDWLRSNAGAYGLRFPLPDTDAGHLEYDANWQGTLPNAQPASVSRLPVEPPPIMNSALMGLSASRSKPETSMPPIFSQAMRGFRDGGAVEAALRIASKQTDRNPTDAQKEAGNYQKGKVRIHGLEIAIENPKGSTRSGTDKDGKPWRCVLPAHYGDIKRSQGADGDAVDCYIGEHHAADKVYIVDQIDAKTGRFDEHKCMLDYPNKTAALADYRKAFSDGKADDRIGAVSEMSVAEFRDWVKSPASRKPVGKFANGGTVMPSTRRNPAVALALDVARRQKRADGGPVASEPSDLLKYPRAFGAGLVDPMGVTGYAARGVAHVAPSALSPETARAFADRMAGYRAESPVAAGMATMLLPGMGALRLAGMTTREALATAPHWAVLGGAGGNMYDAITNPSSPPLDSDAERAREEERQQQASRALDRTREREIMDLQTQYGMRRFFDGPKSIFGDTDRSVQPLPGAPYAGGGRVGYADDGEPLDTMDWTPETERRRALGPPAPVARSANTPLGDLAARGVTPISELLERYLPGSLANQLSDSPAFDTGSIVSGIEGLSRDYARGASGLEDAERSGRDFAEGNIGRGVGHAALAVASPLMLGRGPVQSAMFSSPTRTMLGFGAAGALGEGLLDVPAAEAQQTRSNKAPPAAPSPPPPSAPPTLTGAPTDRAAEVIATDPVLKALREQIAAQDKIAKAHPSEQVQSNRARAEAEAARLRKEYNERVGKLTQGYQPFDQAFPFLAQYRTPIGIIAPAGAAWATKALGNALSRARAEPWNRAVAQADRAFDRGDDIAFAYNADRAGQHLAHEPTSLLGRSGRVAGDFTRDTALPVVAGVTVGTELSMMPHQHNSVNAPPGSSARADAERAQSNFWSTAAPGAALGFLGGMTGSHMLPAGRPGYRPVPESRQLQNMLDGGGGRASTSISSGPASLPALAPPAARDVPALPPPAGDSARAGRLLENREAGRPFLGLAAEEPAALTAAPRGGPPLLPAPLPNLSAPSNSNDPRVLTRVRDARGRTNLHDEDGSFAVNPRSMRQQRLRERERNNKKGDDNPEDGRKHGGLVNAALEIARRYMGGRVGYQHGGSVAGPIIGDDGGRDDKKPVSVKSGSFVIPADVVSGLPSAGGNTLAGMRILEQQFGKPDPRAMAAGGPATDVPIRISSGEFVVSPDQVAKVGGGDMQKGHLILDKMVVKLRKQHGEALAKLPPPARD